MNPSTTDSGPQNRPPNKGPQIGRREIGAFLALLAALWQAETLEGPSPELALSR